MLKWLASKSKMLWDSISWQFPSPAEAQQRDCTVWIFLFLSSPRRRLSSLMGRLLYIKGDSIVQSCPQNSKHRFIPASLKCSHMISECILLTIVDIAGKANSCGDTDTGSKATFRPPVIYELANWESFIPFSFPLSSYIYCLTEEYLSSMEEAK